MKRKPTSRAVPDRVLREAWQAGREIVTNWPRDSQLVFGNEWNAMYRKAMRETARVILAWAERNKR